MMYIYVILPYHFGLLSSVDTFVLIVSGMFHDDFELSHLI